jgi:hypothetical protein
MFSTAKNAGLVNEGEQKLSVYLVPISMFSCSKRAHWEVVVCKLLQVNGLDVLCR